MSINVDDVRLPASVETGATFKLTTETQISTGYGGKEVRFAKRRPRVEATLNILSEDAGAVISLFRSQVGPRYAFKVRDQSDFHATGEELTMDGDGNYPLTITYNYNSNRPEVRYILLPDEDTFELKIDDTVNTNWSFELSTDANGLPILLIVPSSPTFGSGSTVTWTGIFDVPMRFAVDELPSELIASSDGDDPIRIVAVQLIEVFN